MPLALKHKLMRSIDEKITELDIHMTNECTHLIEGMIALGIRKMILGRIIDKPAKRMVAEQNFNRFLEKLISQSRDLKSYPKIDERTFELALSETGSLWPFRTG